MMIGSTAAGLAAFIAASSGGSVTSQSLATNRRPVHAAERSLASQTMGAAMTSGDSSGFSFDRATPADMRVSLAPPGSSTLQVTPVPARSFAQAAVLASSAALEGP